MNWAKPLTISSFPGCCTSRVLHNFGEHGELDMTTPAMIRDVIKTESHLAVTDIAGEITTICGCIFATSINPAHVAALKEVGFKEVDSYKGIMGTVHILTLHEEVPCSQIGMDDRTERYCATTVFED